MSVVVGRTNALSSFVCFSEAIFRFSMDTFFLRELLRIFVVELACDPMTIDDRREEDLKVPELPGVTGFNNATKSVTWDQTLTLSTINLKREPQLLPTIPVRPQTEASA